MAISAKAKKKDLTGINLQAIKVRLEALEKAVFKTKKVRAKK